MASWSSIKHYIKVTFSLIMLEDFLGGNMLKMLKKVQHVFGLADGDQSAVNSQHNGSYNQRTSILVHSP